MTTTTKEPTKDYRKLFYSHGVDLPDEGDEVTGDCPFCNKEGHLYVNRGTGLWKCHRCGEEGNGPTFLRKLWDASFKKTKATDYTTLSKDRGISVEILKAYGLAKSVTTDEWLLPIDDGGKGLPNLFRYTQSGEVQSSGACDLVLFGMDRKPKATHKTIWICEGPWDGMAWDHVLRSVKSKGKALRGSNAVVALPGAGSCHKLLPALCQGRDVRLLLDNDEAGHKGTAGILKALAAAKVKPKSIKVIRWPNDLAEGYDVRDVASSLTAVESYAFVNGHLDEPDFLPESEGEDTPQFEIYSGAELASLKLDMSYLVDRVLCKDHFCLIVGPVKSMKTSLAIDLSVSLAVGGRFLNYFPCQKSRVLLMSGESGPHTIRETAIRIGEAYGHKLDKMDDWFFCQSVPQFGRDDHLALLAEQLESRQIEVLIVDPAYLCMNTEGRESSVFPMGQLLARISSLCKSKGVTFILLHHTTKNVKPGQPITITDSAWAGFGEYTRQWITVNRTKDYKPGSGHHELTVCMGGSMGHSGSYDVAIHEGTNDQGNTRHWKPEVVPKAANAIEEKQNVYAAKVLLFLKDHPKGETLRNISQGVGVTPNKVTVALEHLIGKGRVAKCQIKKAKGTFPGYRLSPKKSPVEV
jgi:hypothetical protein